MLYGWEGDDGGLIAHAVWVILNFSKLWCTHLLICHNSGNAVVLREYVVANEPSSRWQSIPIENR